MKKYILILFSLLLANLTWGAVGDTFEEGSLIYTVISEEPCEVSVKSAVNIFSGELVIPSKIFGNNKEYTVTEIGYQAFFNAEITGELIIPDSVTRIGDRAFWKCSGLISVTIGCGLKSVGYDIFYGCNNIKEVIYNAEDCENHNHNDLFPSSVETVILGNKVRKLPQYMFEGCKNITSITIPNSVETIGIYAFSGCSGLQTLALPNSVKEIDSYAFYNCEGLESLVIPDSVSLIGGEAFRNCSGLGTVTIGRGMKQMGSFLGCDNLKKVIYNAENCESVEKIFPSSLETVIFGEEVKTIPLNMFSECENITTITIPNSVTTIGTQAFLGCSGLKTVQIGNSVNSIGYGAFRDCKELNSILIPESVNNIQEYAFYGCNSLKEVVFEAEDCNYASPNYHYSLFPSNVETVILGEKVKTIPDYMFKYCENITSLTIPNSVTSIGKSAFSFCTGLKSLIIPSTVVSIGSAAFYECPGIETLDLPNVSTIGDGAFYNCGGLKSVFIGNSVTSIGSEAFGRCYSLIKSAYPNTVTDPPFPHGAIVTYNPEDAIIEDGLIFGKDKTEILFVPYTFAGEYIIPDKVTSIGESAFANCAALTSIVIPESVTSIGESAFAYCGALTSIVIPDSVTEMGSESFFGCKELLSVEIGRGIKSLDYLVFYGCKKIKDVIFNAEYCENISQYDNTYYSLFPSSVETVIFGEGVKTIPSYIFYECAKITSIILPNSVISIGDWAFYDCIGIEVVELPYVPTIGNYAFFLCGGLKSVLLGPSANSIGGGAFDACYSLVKCAYPNNLSDPFPSCLTVAYNPDGVIIEDGWIYGKDRKEIIFAPYTLSGDYIVSDEIISIEEKAFAECIGLTSIVIPDSVEDIGSDAFKDCENLLSVTIGRGVKSIGGYIFSECNNLKDVIFEAEDCKDYTRLPQNLENIVFGENVKTIPDGICDGCKKLTSITIPNSVISIGADAFNNCSCLKSVEMGNSVTSLGHDAFNSCTELASVRLSNSLSIIGSSAFEDCFNLKEIILPPSVNKIGNSAFISCKSLEKIVLGNIQTISHYAFALDKLSTIYITAPEPPTLGNNVWYDEWVDEVLNNAVLYVQDEAAKDAYMTSKNDWSKFKNITTMTVPTTLTVDKTSINGKAGETVQLTARLEPEDVTLPYIFWRSTNPEIATVDHNGLVTIHKDDMIEALSEYGEESQACKIIAETLYYNGPIAEVSVNSPVTTGIMDIDEDGDFYSETDGDDSVEVYNLSGIRVADSVKHLKPGIYIVRRGTEAKKIVVK